MSYVKGGLIEAADFNAFSSQINQVYGVGFGNSGYGQTGVTIPTVSGGYVELVKSVEWTALRTAILACANHQGTTVSLPTVAQVAPASLIQAHVPPNTGNIPTALSSISTNRLQAATGVRATTFDKLITTRTTAWTTLIQHEFTVTFSNVEQARYFFNSSSEVIIRPTRSGGSATGQNTSWTNVLNLIGTLQIGHSSVVSSNGAGTTSNIGYYQLPLSSYTLLYTINTVSPSYYTTNRVRLYGQTVDGPGGTHGDNGRILKFRIDFEDNHGGVPDSTDGTFTSHVDERKANTYLSITSPSYANVTLLTAGS